MQSLGEPLSSTEIFAWQQRLDEKCKSRSRFGSDVELLNALRRAEMALQEVKELLVVEGLILGVTVD